MAKSKNASGDGPARIDGAKRGEAGAEKKKGVNPFRFIQQVRDEGKKVTWTTWKETRIGTIMVLIMVILLAVFFWLVDQVFIMTIVCMLLDSPTCPYDFLRSGPSLTTGF